MVVLNPHALIDGEGPTAVFNGQATATEELIVTEVIGQAGEIVIELEVTKGQAIDEEDDEFSLVLVTEAAHFERTGIEVN